ncbi:MAG: DNA repair protein RecN [Pseudomonadales bacterium]|nr:DNA repair protein RecN [Pseudomonadales bacterium]
MLTHLSIKNFAVVRLLDIELNTGLTVITGETGAGKSIMIDALGLVLGDRADNSIIRDGADRAEISAVFDVAQDTAASTWLEEHEFQSDECIIRRILSTDGRSKAFINDSPATLQQIRALGETLLDIHSQHEHQSLLKKHVHRQLLDDYAGSSDLAQNLAFTYQSWSAAEKRLSHLKQQLEQQRQQHELLGYQLDELTKLDLQEGEVEQLELDQTRLADAEQILTVGQQISSLCSADGVDDTAIDCISLIAQAIRFSDQLKDEDLNLQNCIGLLESAKIQIEEAMSSLQQYLERIEVNPERLQRVEQRLGDAYQLARKHRVQPQELIQTLKLLQEEYSQLDNIDEEIQKLQTQCDNEKKRYTELAESLSDSRKKCAQQLNQQISTNMHLLGMPGSSFVTQLTPLDQAKLSPYGKEEIEFLISTNPGQAPRPLQKVASGGELSRISLAIQVILAIKTDTPTLLFDEVDVGIGGATAEVVGQLLRKIGEQGQVICVTHQPQVAAKAHHHLYVSKNISRESTDSQVAALSYQEKIAEIARMLGGIKLTDQTLAHAEEMIAPVSR